MKSSERERNLPHVPRRTFLRASLFGSVGAGLGGFGLASLGFLWPRPGDELAGEAPLGDAEALAEQIASERTPVRVPEGGISVIVWDPSDEAAMQAYGAEHQAVLSETTALMALNSADCPHLGCAVPWCQSSQWFECPCHGSRYNRWGEWVGGPAPRGLDRYASYLDEGTGQFVVDLGAYLIGPARTSNVLQQPAEGPACVDV